MSIWEHCLVHSWHSKEAIPSKVPSPTRWTFDGTRHLGIHAAKTVFLTGKGCHIKTFKTYIHIYHISAILSFFKFQNIFPILHELPNTSSQAKPKLSPSEAHLTHVDNASFDSLERRWSSLIVADLAMPCFKQRAVSEPRRHCRDPQFSPSSGASCSLSNSTMCFRD